MIGQILEYNTVVTKAEFLFMIQSVNLPPTAHTITFSAHCSTLHPLQPKAKHPVYIFSAHTAGAITSSVHTLQQPLHFQCTYCSSHYIFSAHFSHLQPCTAICSKSSVHTAAMYTHVQLSAVNLQCTLQPTAAIYNHLHCSYSIQCTLQLHYLYSTSSAPLNHHRVSLYHYWHTSRAVSRH